MGVIPGNENFPDVRRGYGVSQVKEFSETVGIGGTGTFFKPGNARNIFMIITPGPGFEVDSVDLVLRNAGASQQRKMTLALSSVSGDGNKMNDVVVKIAGEIIPSELAVANTSSRATMDVDWMINY